MTMSDGVIDQFDQNELVNLIPRVRAFARFLCKDASAAEDLTQAALLRAWRRRDTFTPKTNMKSWLLTIVRNQFYADKRRSWRVVPLDPHIAENTLVANCDVTAAMELDDVRRGLLELGAEQRQALELIKVSGVPYGEAADLCGCPIGTIKSRVNRARESLTHIMARGDLKSQPLPAEDAMATIVAASEVTRRAAVSRLQASGESDRQLPLAV